jgi:hypothetical protein
MAFQSEGELRRRSNTVVCTFGRMQHMRSRRSVSLARRSAPGSPAFILDRPFPRLPACSAEFENKTSPKTRTHSNGFTGLSTDQNQLIPGRIRPLATRLFIFFIFRLRLSPPSPRAQASIRPAAGKFAPSSPPRASAAGVGGKKKKSSDITAEQLSEIREAFNLFDTDNSGAHSRVAVSAAPSALECLTRKHVEYSPAWWWPSGISPLSSLI